MGIYLFGTAVLKVEGNLLESNVLDVTKADRIRINTGTSNTTLKSNVITGRDTSTYDINILTNEVNATQFIDQIFENYNFSSAGEAILVRNSSYGEIQFLSPVTGNGSSLSQNIRLGNNSIYVNASVPGLNKSARLTLYNIPYAKPVILQDNVFCSDCTFISYGGRNLTFNVAHFSAYTSAENAVLHIWDDSDAMIIPTNNLTNFYANYTNFTSGERIVGSGTPCTITFNDLGSILMTYNASTQLYWFNRTFRSGGNIHYTILCEDIDGRFANLNATDYAAIETTQGPQSPTNITLIRSERGNISSTLGSVDTQAGNISLLDIRTSSMTQHWQGYFGQVGGTILLTDAWGSTLYDWSIVGPIGEIYATRAPDVNFENIDCSNTTEISAEESFIGQEIFDPESVRNTFTTNTHPAFSVGSFVVQENTCNATNLFVNSTAQSASFYELLLSDDAANLVYTAIVDANQTGFDNNQYDFQMLVGENGNDAALTPYYFFMEIS
jgi:hypothetical protein